MLARQNGVRIWAASSSYGGDNDWRLDVSYVVLGSTSSMELPQMVRTAYRTDGIALGVELIGHMLPLRPWVPGQDLIARFEENEEASYQLAPKPTTVTVDGEQVEGLSVSGYGMHAVGVRMGNCYLTAAMPMDVLPQLRLEFEAFHARH